MLPDVFAEDIMSKDIITIDSEESIESAAHKLAGSRIHNLVVLDNGKFAGLFGYRQVAMFHRRSGRETPVANHLEKPPKIKRKTRFVDIADYMQRLNTKMLPVVEGSRVLGVVSLSDVARAALSSEHFRGKKITEFMTPGALTLNHGDNLGRALKTILDKDISHLPVLGSSGEVAGVVDSVDIMRAFFSNGGRGIMREYSPQEIGAKPRSTVNSAMYEESEGIDKTAISAFARDVFITRRPGDLVAESLMAADKIGSDIVLAMENKTIVGILTYKDILPFIAGFKEKKSTYVRISGLDSGNISDFEAIEVNRMIEGFVRKIAGITDINSFSLHVKTYHRKGFGRHREKGTGLIKYSIRLKLLASTGLFVAREHGWDVIDAAASAIKRIERMVLDEKDNKVSSARNRWRMSKYLLKEGQYFGAGE